jgi:hypothetical protein
MKTVDIIAVLLAAVATNGAQTDLGGAQVELEKVQE